MSVAGWVLQGERCRLSCRMSVGGCVLQTECCRMSVAGWVLQGGCCRVSVAG